MSPIVCFRGYWSAASCARIRAAMDAGTATPAEVIAHGYVVDRSARQALDVEIDEPTCEFAEGEMHALGQRLEEHFRQPLPAFEGPAFLRYGRGGMYGPHRDAGGTAGARVISVTLFLNTAVEAGGQDFSGGALRFYDVPAIGCVEDVHAEAGTLVAFPSDVVHEVMPVMSGTRDSLVTWFLSPAG